MKTKFMLFLLALGALVFVLIYFSPDNKPRQERDINQKGLDFYKDHKYLQALDEFTKNTKSLDKEILFEAYFNQGCVYDELKQYVKAIDDYSKATEIKPDFAIAYYDLCVAYFHIGNYNASVENYLKSISYRSEETFSDEIKNILGNYCKKSGDEAFHSILYELAIDNYEKMQKIEPGLLTTNIKSNLSTAYFEFGKKILAEKKYQDALTKFEKAYELKRDPKYNIQISNTYAKLARESEVKGDYQSAFDYYKEALGYSSGNIIYIIDRIKQLPTPRPPEDDGYQKSYLNADDLFGLRYYSTDCLDADKSEEYLIFKMRIGSSSPMDVYYFTKTNQVSLTHLSKFLISFYNRKKILDVMGNYLNEGKDKLNEYSSKEVEDYNSQVEHYNVMLNDFKGSKDNYTEASENFYKRIKPFAALLPLKELNKFDYSLNSNEEVKLDIKSVPIDVFLNAFKLLKSGNVAEGSYLLDAIGQIKVAYLAALFASFEVDEHAREKFSILQSDLIEYYNFVDNVFKELKVNRNSIPYSVESRIHECRMSMGIFNSSSDIYNLLNRYYKADSLTDQLIGYSRLTKILNEFFGI